MLGSFLLMFVLLQIRGAHAQSMQPSLSGLVQDPQCQSEPAQSMGSECIADQAAFGSLVNQYGVAIAATGSNTAQTPGLAGFELSYEGAFTQVDAQSKAMRLGTRGGDNQSDTPSAAARRDWLQLHSLRITKGLGLGFEASTQLGWMTQTSLFVVGGDLQLSILEGLHSGILKYFPDFSVSGSARAIVGSSDLNLSAFGMRVQLSQPLFLGGASVISPMVGFQSLWLKGSSRQVDLTPQIDEPDFSENLAQFDVERFRRQRVFVGLQYRHEWLFAHLQTIFDVASPKSVADGTLEDAKSQLVIVALLGASL